MALVELLKKKSKYMDNGVEKTGINFSVKCGDSLIPIGVRYFEDPETKKDPYYSTRKAVLSAFAEEIIDTNSDKKSVE